MFERFTDRARRVLALAQEEAAALGHNFFGTEHILLGLVREPDGIAGHVLREHGVTYEAVRRAVLEAVGPGARATGLRDADALAAIGIDLGAVVAAVEDAFGKGALDRPKPGRGRGRPRFAPRAKMVIELALREALTLGHNYIGTEHLLLAILRLGEGVAVAVVEQLAASSTDLRADVIARLDAFRRGA